MRSGAASSAAACAVVTLLLVVSTSAAVQNSGKRNIGAGISAASRHEAIPVTDERATSAAFFMVDELNRRESSFAGTRQMQAILSAEDQVLHTGHVYHLNVLLAGGSKGNEISEASVFVAPTGASTLLKAKANKVSGHQLIRMGVVMTNSGVDDGSVTQVDGNAGMTNDEPVGAMAVEFDVGFLDGIQVESPNSAVTGGAANPQNLITSRSSQQAASHSDAAEAAKRLKANADTPLPLNTSRQRKASKLGKV